MDSKKESAEMIYEVAVLRGPSAIAFAQWMEKEPVLKGKKMQVKVLDSPEQMQALLVKGEADIAVLPMISAANLYNKGVRYPLLGCPIWGTLYLVGRDHIVPPVYLFGAGTTPDILARYYLEQKGSYTYDYSFATAREVLLSLQTDKVQTAVLSEPFLSMAGTGFHASDSGRLESSGFFVVWFSADGGGLPGIFVGIKRFYSDSSGSVLPFYTGKTGRGDPHIGKQTCIR